MTPKEKAKKLVRKYWDLGGIDVLEAKQCALIAVEEILNNGFQFIDDFEFWKQVKEELLKI